MEEAEAVGQQVVVFHLGFNLAVGIVFIAFTGPVGWLVERLLPSGYKARAEQYGAMARVQGWKEELSGPPQPDAGGLR